MFYPLECFIGLRYIRARRRGVVSFISFASLTGIALGVAALIVILSVMNGFEGELRTRLLSLSGHATVAAPEGVGLVEWQRLETRLADLDGVAGVAPYVLLQGMLSANSNLSPVLVRGVSPEREPAVSSIASALTVGSLADLAGSGDRIILGRILALDLGLRVGDRVSLLVPRFEHQRLAPLLRSFVVSGIFEAGIQDNDARLALIDIDAASYLKGLGGRPQGIAVRLEDPLAVADFRAEVAPLLGDGLKYSDWTIDNASYFRAIRIEKTMMTIILLLIVAVAVFNIVASLTMTVNEKRKDIAILRTCGLEPRRVALMFVVQGAVLGLVGIAFGTALGLALALNIETIVPWLEHTFGFQIMPADVYYVTRIPSIVEWPQVILIPALALLLAALATVYPSRRAARIAPAEALRYD